MKRWDATEADHPTLAKLWDAHTRAIGVWKALTPVERELCRHIANGLEGQALYDRMRVSRDRVREVRRSVGWKMGLTTGQPYTREIVRLVAFVGEAA